MKRPVLMVMLLVAGALAFSYLYMWLLSLLSLLGLPGGLAATGSGGIGSVSAGFSDWFVLPVPILFASFLLWRACAILAADGDRVMAWHRRFHGIALIAAVLLIASVVGLGVALFGIFERGNPGPTGGERMLMFAAVAVMIVTLLASFGLNVMQLYSSVVAFRTLQRRV